MINLDELEAKARAASERWFSSPIMLHHEEVTALIAAMRLYQEALRSYAGKGKYSEWEGPKYLTFDKFGALCAETMGPWEAEQALAEADKILGDTK